jgi:hypothetical protein
VPQVQAAHREESGLLAHEVPLPVLVLLLVQPTLGLGPRGQKDRMSQSGLAA